MIKNKIFLDIEKEVKWLNEMSSKGYKLVNRKGFSYVFEPCEPNKYIYQVEKRGVFSTKEDPEYINFLDELNIRLIDSQLGWFYFEKDNDGKEFEIFTDSASKIKHYQKLMVTLIVISLFSINSIMSTLASPTGSKGPYIFNLSIPLLCNPLIVLACVVTFIKYTKRIKSLNNEKNLVE